jgi:ComF family protein
VRLRSILPRAATLARGLLDAVFPPRCLACRGEAWDGPALLPGLCRLCTSALPVLRAPCARCGREAGAHSVTAPCPRCRDEPLDVEGIVSPLAYRGVARDLVLALKFGGRTPAAIPLGRLLGDAVIAAGRPGDLVVPVPLSAARFRRRGHNQADEIARVVATIAGIERDARALVRRRGSDPQSTLSRAARKRGPRGAFAARRPHVAGRCVLLVDDVVTTGSTASSCARALLRAGAVRVVLAAACRA